MNYLTILINDKDNLEYRNKRELHVDEFLNNIQIILKLLSQTPKILYTKLFKTIRESLTTIINEHNKYFNYKYIIKAGNVDISHKIETIKNEMKILIEDCNIVVYQIKNQSKQMLEESIAKEKNKIMKDINKSKETAFRDNVNKLNLEISKVQDESINESIRKMEKDLEEEKEKTLQKVPYYNRNEAKTKIEQEISKIKQENKIKIRNNIQNHFQTIKNQKTNEIRNNIETKSKEMYKKAINDIELEKKKREKLLNDSMIKLNKYITDEKNKIADIENTIKNKQILKYGNIYDEKYVVEKINLGLIGYYNNNSQNENISFAPIRGGCLSEINNELNIKDISQSQIEELSSLILKLMNPEIQKN